jgi:D-glycero-D-manno-heptose 1,7-bisphosphate phosphatase
MDPNKLRKAVFLDRDGTLIEEVNFLSRIEDLKVFPFTLEALKLLKSEGFLLIVITNQSGIGRGVYSEEAMHAIHRQMQIELDDAIDAFYFCPHLPDEECDCRKPNLGMIRKALDDFEIDMSNSWVVGDKRLDFDVGSNAGIMALMVKTGYGSQHSAEISNQADVAENILDAAHKITGKPV